MFIKRLVRSVWTGVFHRNSGPRRIVHPSPFTLHSSSGFTLIEMIVILVVIGIAAVALLRVFSSSVLGSVDPMLRMQAIAVGQGYLEEALLQAFQDPDQAETGCEEAARADYDDVQDYACINGEAPVDQFGTPLPVAGYTVNVNVTADNLNGVVTQRVDVIVNHAQFTITLTGHRSNH